MLRERREIIRSSLLLTSTMATSAKKRANKWQLLLPRRTQDSKRTRRRCRRRPSSSASSCEVAQRLRRRLSMWPTRPCSRLRQRSASTKAPSNALKMVPICQTRESMLAERHASFRCRTCHLLRALLIARRSFLLLCSTSTERTHRPSCCRSTLSVSRGLPSCERSS